LIQYHILTCAIGGCEGSLIYDREIEEIICDECGMIFKKEEQSLISIGLN